MYSNERMSLRNDTSKCTDVYLAVLPVYKIALSLLSIPRPLCPFSVHRDIEHLW